MDDSLFNICSALFQDHQTAKSKTFESKTLIQKWTKKNVRWYVPSFVASVWLDKNFSIFRMFKQSTFSRSQTFRFGLIEIFGSTVYFGLFPASWISRIFKQGVFSLLLILQELSTLNIFCVDNSVNSVIPFLCLTFDRPVSAYLLNHTRILDFMSKVIQGFTITQFHGIMNLRWNQLTL